MLNCPAHQPVIEAIKTPLTLLFYSRLFPGRRALNVVTQQWNKRHGDHQSTKQCRGHDYGETLEKFSGVAAEHEERKIGNDVRQGCVKDGRGQLGRSQPRCYSARQSFRKTAFDTVASYYRNIDQQT